MFAKGSLIASYETLLDKSNRITEIYISILEGKLETKGNLTPIIHFYDL